MTKGTCSPVDALPSGPSSRFRRCSYAIAHAGEKRSPIIGSLRYTHCTHESVKDSILHNFKKESPLRIVVATIAFGLGVDCPDVRQIVHWGKLTIHNSVKVISTFDSEMNDTTPNWLI